MSKLHVGLILLLGSLLGCSSADDPGTGSGLTIMPRDGAECDDGDCNDWPDDVYCEDWQSGNEGDQDDCRLDCPQGGPTGPIAVHFSCTKVYVVSCKDLSNVVIEYKGGEHKKFDGLKGHYGTFGGGDRIITTVWVKAGDNGSGDGPGYGERFDSDRDCRDHGDGERCVDQCEAFAEEVFDECRDEDDKKSDYDGDRCEEEAEEAFDECFEELCKDHRPPSSGRECFSDDDCGYEETCRIEACIDTCVDDDPICIDTCVGVCVPRGGEGHCVCPTIFDPVCDGDGNIYPNACVAECEGVDPRECDIRN